jgi:hypothetical protein
MRGRTSPRSPISPNRTGARFGPPTRERLDREVKRRSDVVGIFPNPKALLRLATCVLIEAHDEWQVSDRRYLSETSMAALNPPAPIAGHPAGEHADTAPALGSTPTEAVPLSA